ncbi:MAG: hypothetical protein KAT15_02605 [Bacteroidales bacterium]|nr:hypothetical protein [Bacteroidales bacterium]
MKRIVLSLLIIVLTLSLSAQDTDSLLLEKVNMLKKELTVIKKKNKSLQAQIYKLQKMHAKDLEESEKKFATAEEVHQKYELMLTELDQAIKDSEENTLESMTVLGEWTKKMIMILTIVAAILFLVLLILVITNRRRIEGDYKKLEAKVDNTKEAIDLEIKDMLKRHAEDITALKAVVEKGKK